MVWELLAASLLFGSVRCHDWAFGSCPSVAPFENLSIDKFLGLWYVMEQFDTTSTCLTLNFTRTSETSLEITKHRQFYILDKTGIDHTNTYTGTLDIPFSTNPGFLRVKWPLNAAGKADFIIFDTDYEKYAGIYDCQQIAFFAYRQSAAILSRTAELEQMFVDRIKRRLDSYKVSNEHFSKIDHSNCRREDGDLKINVDQNTFKNLFSSAADSVKDTANQLAGGVRSIADTVVDGVKRIGSTGPVNTAAEFNAGQSEDLKDVELLN